MTRLWSALAALVLFVPCTALAQPTPLSVTPKTRAELAPKAEATPPSPSPPATAPFDPGIEFVPKDPTYAVTLSLEDADLEELVHTIGELTGKRFVIATSKAKGIKTTIFSPQKISVAEAYRTFLAVLQANGLTVLPDGSLLKIVDAQDITKQATPVSRHGEATTGEERYVTRVHRLSHVGAEDVAANILSKFQTRDGTIVPYAPGNLLIITDTGTNILRMLRILEDIDVGGAKEQVWLEPVFNGPSTDLQRKLSELLDLKATDASGAKPSAGNGEARVTKIVALDRPNALAIVGTAAGYARVLELIKRMDVTTAGESEVHVVPLQYADAKKIAAELSDALGGQGASAATAQSPGGSSRPNPTTPLPVLEAPVKISAEETTNALLITASLRDFASVRDVISKIDQPHRQVYIEAVMLDVSTLQDTEVGVQYHGAGTNQGSLLWGGLNPLSSVSGPISTALNDPSMLQGLALGVQGPSTGLTLPGPTGVGVSVPAFGAMLMAYAQTTDADVLSTPHIIATDNMPAEIKVQLHTAMQKNAQSFNLGGSSASPVSGALPVVASTPQYATLGPRIKIVPHVNDSDDVRLDIEENISDAPTTDQNSSLGTISFNERDATTTLTVKDRQTVVIGGLVRDNVTHGVTKIPFLGDIPILGALFRSTSNIVQKQNLVLILTPYIIRDQEDLRRIFERKMEERQDFIDHTSLFSSHAYNPPRDYLHTEGLLGAICKAYRQVASDRATERHAPRTVQAHGGVEPIDMPAPATTPAEPASPKPSRSPAPAVVEKVEH